MAQMPGGPSAAHTVNVLSHSVTYDAVCKVSSIGANGYLSFASVAHVADPNRQLVQNRHGSLSRVGR
jgi:hypothetical protein